MYEYKYSLLCQSDEKTTPSPPPGVPRGDTKKNRKKSYDNTKYNKEEEGKCFF